MPERYIAYLADIEQPLRIDPGTQLQSPFASFRLRTLIPGRHLARDIAIWVVPIGHTRRDPELEAMGEAAAAVVTKLPSHFIATHRDELRAFCTWMEGWRARGRRLLADLSDNYAHQGDDPFFGEYQDRLAQCADLVVTCEALRAELAHRASRSITVIEDPFERPAAAAVRTRASRPLELVWYGVYSGPTRDWMAGAIVALACALRQRPARLAFITGRRSGEAVRVLAQRLAAANPAMAFEFVPWSEAAVATGITRSDFVLLPQDPASPWGRVKSHNRLLEAIRGGRLALASPIFSYLELKDFAWVGGDLAEGLAWALAHPDDAARRVAAGQDHLEARFSPAAIAGRWRRALGLA